MKTPSQQTAAKNIFLSLPLIEKRGETVASRRNLITRCLADYLPLIKEMWIQIVQQYCPKKNRTAFLKFRTIKELGNLATQTGSKPNALDR